MFFSRRRGLYYLHYRDQSGRWQKVSARTRSKIEALEFLRSFNPLGANLTLSAFCDRYLACSRKNHAPGSTARHHALAIEVIEVEIAEHVGSNASHGCHDDLQDGSWRDAEGEAPKSGRRRQRIPDLNPDSRRRE
jgi:hypothetical protein